MTIFGGVKIASTSSDLAPASSSTVHCSSPSRASGGARSVALLSPAPPRRFLFATTPARKDTRGQVDARPPLSFSLARVPAPALIPPLALGSGLHLSFPPASEASQSLRDLLAHSTQSRPLPPLPHPPPPPPMHSPTQRSPLPVPPSNPPPHNRYPNTYGPSSTIRPQKPAGQNAHEAFQYGLQGQEVPWVPYATPTTGRGSTFFVSGSGTQRLGGGGAGGGGGRPALSKRKPLPTPMERPGQQQQQQSPQPQFTAKTAYSPPSSPQALPPGAMPSPHNSPPSSPRPQTRPQTYQTKVPLGTGSSVMVHSGFWQILAATGSRFVGAGPGTTTTASRFGDGMPGGSSPGGLEMFGPGMQQSGVKGPSGLGAAGGGPRRGETAPAAGVGDGGNLKGKKRVSVDMISRPGGFA